MFAQETLEQADQIIGLKHSVRGQYVRTHTLDVTFTGRNIATDPEKAVIVVGGKSGADRAIQVAQALYRPFKPFVVDGAGQKKWPDAAWHEDKLFDIEKVDEGPGYITWRLTIREAYLD